MNLKQQRQTLLDEAKAIVTQAQAAGRDLTDGERTLVEQKAADVEGLDARIKSAEASSALMARIGALTPGAGNDDDPHDRGTAAKSLGEHFVKSIGSDGLSRLKTVSGYVAYAPEFKAATDPNLRPASLAPTATQIDTTVVRGYRRASVADLMGSGSLSGNAVTYFVEGTVEGGFATVAEAGQKPQLHFTDPEPRTDSLKKIAGWWDNSDEMVEDFPFWVSEINQRGLYLLSMVEESQLLSGDGTGSNVLGLLQRSGIQTEAAANNTDNADAIFRGMTKVQTATGLTADGIIINPQNYQELRLRKDANDQYYGGGFFAGQYGNGGLTEQPPLWGLRTIVSAAVPAGTAVVGAFQAATTVYRKGGVRVESTNSDQGKFTKNIITTRIEERIALAVRRPSAIVKVTLSSTDPA